MSSQKEIRQRIVSVSSTKQITSAMKMVAASKLRKAQDRIIRLRPYANNMQHILSNVTESLEGSIQNPFTMERNPDKVLIVSITSQRGLCGALNTNVVRKAIEVARSSYPEAMQNNNVHFMALGKKGVDMLKKRGFFLIGAPVELTDTPDFEQTLPLSGHLMNLFTSGEYSRIEIIYNQFRNAAVHRVTVERFLPLSVSVSEDPKTKKPVTGKRMDYIFEPDSEHILQELIPQTLKIQIYKALTDASASEHGGRMTAMTQATDNATQMISDLTLQYNKARQAAITSEISEIVSGAAALRG